MFVVQLLLAVIYLAFISLGLPDALLGSAWPMMYPEFEVPVSYAGIISVIISVGTILSSLMSDRLNRWLGAGKVTAISVALTAVSLLSFSFSHSFWMLCIFAIPYGLGAGSIDAALNNYVAQHYSSRHMSWLHCMWGIGASVGPYILGFALTRGMAWNMGYRYIALLQFGLTLVLFLSLPLWKKSKGSDSKSIDGKVLSLREIFSIPGAKSIIITFFCYCALEQTAGLWVSSYLVLYHGQSSQIAARWAALFYLGITVGRAIGGFLTIKFNDTQMIRIGEGFLVLGILLLPFSQTTALFGLILIGLGCAPIYPSIMHSTPVHFGADRSQAIIGVLMASAYIGSCITPPIFGLIANHISASVFPFFLLIIFVVMAYMHEVLCKTVQKSSDII